MNAESTAGEILSFRQAWDTVDNDGTLGLVNGELVVGVELNRHEGVAARQPAQGI